MDLDRANHIVLVADWNRARLERIREVFRSSYRVEPVSRCDRILPTVHRLAPSVVIFPLRWRHVADACSSEVCLGDRVLDAVIGLPQPPLAVAFAESAQYLPLPEYCSPFAKGATALLDESDPRFYQELRTKVITGLKRIGESDRRAHCVPALLALAGSSPAIHGIRDQVLKAAKLSDAPVLITGESGTGKEVVAMAIHRLDETRAKGPFIAVNCSAVSSSLAESEFFGHKRGAFTDANSDRQGYFRAAHGGVLFLDEISELDQSLQPKLLRALQERSVRPVGEEKEQTIDIRIIAASNKDLPAEVARGAFRMDLYQRLDVLSVRLPPLRARKEDIEPLVRFFVKKHASCYAGVIQAIDSRVLELLTTLDYEGNVRELENLVRKILFHKETGDTIAMADLPSEIVARMCDGHLSDSLEIFADALLEKVKQGLSCTEALAECERLLLARAMQESHGSRSKMAAILKLSPRTLFNRLRARGLLAPTQQLEQH
ncbi:MAG: sigma 54-interacting transcriptional regulator [Nitrospira sp.]|nr:sigma 54-interacting transcriptional regulator [Nitrospira sp.]